MKLALLTVLWILSGCTRRTEDECKPVPIQRGLECPEGYCVREYRNTPMGDVHYDCVPEKCNKGHCATRFFYID